MTPAMAPRSSPMPWPVWSASSNATCAIPAGGCTFRGRSRNERCGCAGRLMSCTSAGAAHRPAASWPSSWGEEEVLEGLAAVSSRQEVSLDQPVGDGNLRLGDLVRAPGAREEPEDLLVLPGLVSV